MCEDLFLRRIPVYLVCMVRKTVKLAVALLGMTVTCHQYDDKANFKIKSSQIL